MAQLLSIETVSKKVRNWITLDGKKYDILSASDFSLQESMLYEKAGGRVDKFLAKGAKMKSSEVVELDKELDVIVCGVVPSLGAKMLRKLKTQHKLQIALAFIQEDAKTRAGLKKKKAPGRAKG